MKKEICSFDRRIYGTYIKVLRYYQMIEEENKDSMNDVWYFMLFERKCLKGRNRVNWDFVFQKFRFLSFAVYLIKNIQSLDYFTKGSGAKFIRKAYPAIIQCGLFPNTKEETAVCLTRCESTHGDRSIFVIDACLICGFMIKVKA